MILTVTEKNEIDSLIKSIPNKDLLFTIVDFVIEETLAMSVFISYLETKAYKCEGKNMVRIKFYLDPSIERIISISHGLLNVVAYDLEGSFCSKFCNQAIDVSVTGDNEFDITINLDTVLIPQ